MEAIDIVAENVIVRHAFDGLWGVNGHQRQSGINVILETWSNAL